MLHSVPRSLAIQRSLYVLAICLWTVVVSESALGDVVWLKDGRIAAGRLMSENEQRIEFQMESFLKKAEVALDSDEETRDAEMQRGQIVVFEKPNLLRLHVNIDRPRLEKLDPRRPHEYLEYAEELALEKMDPTAVRLAKRLFLLATVVGDVDVQQTSLLGLAALESDSDRKKNILLYLALKTGYLGDSQSLKGTSDSAEIQPTLLRDSETEAKYMLRLVRAIRRGQTQEAINLLRFANTPKVEDSTPSEETDDSNASGAQRDDGVEIARAAIERWSSQWSIEQWNTLARSKSITDLQLRQLLTLEIELMKEANGFLEPGEKRVSSESNDRTTQARKNWAEQGLQSSAGSVVLPMIESLIDPSIGKLNLRATRYRDGVWIE